MCTIYAHVLYKDNESVKKLWVNLLLKAIDSKPNKRMKNIFINILASLDSDSAQLFEKLLSSCPDDKASKVIDSGFKKELESESVAILDSLGLIILSENSCYSYSITLLGQSFYKVVSRP